MLLQLSLLLLLAPFLNELDKLDPFCGLPPRRRVPADADSGGPFRGRDGDSSISSSSSPRAAIDILVLDGCWRLVAFCGRPPRRRGVCALSADWPCSKVETVLLVVVEDGLSNERKLVAFLGCPPRREPKPNKLVLADFDDDDVDLSTGFFVNNDGKDCCCLREPSCRLLLR